MRAAELREPPFEQARGHVRVATCEVQRDRGFDRLGLVLEPGQQVLGLVEPALQHAELGEARSRVHAAGALTRLGQLAQGVHERLLGVVDAAVSR